MSERELNRQRKIDSLIEVTADSYDKIVDRQFITLTIGELKNIIEHKQYKNFKLVRFGCINPFERWEGRYDRVTIQDINTKRHYNCAHSWYNEHYVDIMTSTFPHPAQSQENDASIRLYTNKLVETSWNTITCCRY